jgi:hypothetical protein
MMEMWPDLLICMIDSIGGELNVHNLGFKSSMIWTPATVTPLLY